MAATDENIVFFMRQMTRVNLTLRAYMRRRFKEHGINITFEMLQVLRFLWEKNGVNQQEIADAIMKDKTSVTYLIDNLVRRKLVRRTADHSDRRNKIIVLTEGGEKLKMQITPWLREMYHQAAMGLDPGLLTAGASILERIQENFRETS
jgi:DNA-binding MarR family transcriptional regulator